jgi:CheY-like chemotaxis protein
MARSTGKFPAVRNPSPRPRPITGPHRIRLTILVMDDEPDVARLVAKMLGKTYDVILATDGDEGLQRAAAVLPDLILLDLDMPKIDGWEVCRRLKADPRMHTIPVVMMTAGFSTPEDADRAFALGAAEYLVKPFVREVLVHNVERILGTRSSSKL